MTRSLLLLLLLLLLILVVIGVADNTVVVTSNWEEGKGSNIDNNVVVAKIRYVNQTYIDDINKTNEGESIWKRPAIPGPYFNSFHPLLAWESNVVYVKDIATKEEETSNNNNKKQQHNAACTIDACGFEYVDLDVSNRKLMWALTEIATRQKVEGARVGLGDLKHTSLLSKIMSSVFFSRRRRSTAANAEEEEEESAEETLATELRGWNRAFRLKDSYNFILEVSGMIYRSAYAGGTPRLVGVDGIALDFHIDQVMHGEPFYGIVTKIPFAYSLFQLGVLNLQNLWIPLNNGFIRPLAFLNKKQCDESDKLRTKWYPKLNKDLNEKDGFLAEVYQLRRNASRDLNKAVPRIFYHSKMPDKTQAVLFSTTDTFHASIPPPGDDVLSDLVQFINNQTCPPAEFIGKCERIRVNNLDGMGNRITDERVLLRIQSAIQLVQKYNCYYVIKPQRNESEIAEVLTSLSRSSVEMRVVSVMVKKSHAHLLVCFLAILYYIRVTKT